MSDHKVVSMEPGREIPAKEEELSPEDRLKAVTGPLLAWYEACGRMLPWREKPSPYRVWISEIMLQQTRIEAVKPYFDRFMRELPSVEALASVEDDRLMKLWQGLGYYNRARNLKKAASVVMEEYGGIMPSSYEKLVKLPGIGSYTAGAIASIAFGEAVPAVDGNVLRVLSRILASREDVSRQKVQKAMAGLLIKVMPKESAGSFNQALMELGETICVPNGEPGCMACPIKEFCLALHEGMAGELPVRAASKKRRIEERTVCIFECQDQVGLRRRPDTGLLASLYELPNAEGHLTREELAKAFGLHTEEIGEIEELPKAKHVFSHVEWHMAGYRVQVLVLAENGFIWAKKQELKTIYPLPNAFSRYTKLIK